MINRMEAEIWLENWTSNDDDSGKMDISDVQWMLKTFDKDCEVTIEEVIVWHPQERYIKVRSEQLDEFNEDVTLSDAKTIELHFNSIDAMETMYEALGNLLKKHYETQMEKFK